MVKQWIDPVVEEVRERGRAYTARLASDVHAIFEDLRKYQREHQERSVSQVSVVLQLSQGESSQQSIE